MILKDILDMEDYLKNRCYCPGEIYSSDGFFFQIFSPEFKCKLMGENKDFIAVISSANEKAYPQILIIFKDKDNKVSEVVRYDATKNNIKGVLNIIRGLQKKFTPNEFIENNKNNTLNEVLKLVDAICFIQ